MKQLTTFILSMLFCLPLLSQEIEPTTKAFIKSQLKEFSSTLNFVMSLSPDEAADAEDLDILFGWDSFSYNGKKYGSLSNWVKKYYRNQLTGKEVRHVLDVRLPSIRKKTSLSSDRRIVVDVMLRRETAIVSMKNNSHDYKLEDRPVTLTVIANEGQDLKILAIDGNWDFNPVYPKLTFRRQLSLDRYQSVITHHGGEKSIQVESFLVKDKVYGDHGKLGTVKNFEKTPVTCHVSSKLKYTIHENTVKVNVPYNYSRREKKYEVQFTQRNTDKQILKECRHYITQLGNKHRSAFDVETEYVPTWTMNLHYGSKKTIGFSIAGRFKNTPLTLGLHVAPSITRWKQLHDEFQDAIASGYDLYIYSQTEDTEDYHVKTLWSETNQPSKRDYSAEWDPDSTAIHKKALSYVFVQPGVYITEWMRMELGFGILRSQDTYLKENLPKKVTKEYTPLRPDVPAKATETVYENSGRSFLFKDHATIYFAMRYGVQFNIPLGKRKTLNLGTGYTLSDVNNWDFGLGISWGI